MRVIIAGSRTFTDYEFLIDKLSTLFEWTPTDSDPPEDVFILSGGAKGADQLGEKFASEYEVPLELYPADWYSYGKSAGMIRNARMAANADVLVAFWDGSSRGTVHMIQQALSEGLEVHVYQFGN